MLDKGDEVTGCPDVDDLVLRGFLAGPIGPPGTRAGGEREGAPSRTGASCGERSELMSMMGINVKRRCTSNNDHLDLPAGFHYDQSRQAHARTVLRSTLLPYRVTRRQSIQLRTRPPRSKEHVKV